MFLKNKSYDEHYKIANQELINIDNWLSANRLILNADKTHYFAQLKQSLQRQDEDDSL